MRCSEAFAVTLVGWYLMMPPPSKHVDEQSWSEYWFGSSRSYSQWKIVQSFDSAVDCEAAKKALPAQIATQDERVQYWVNKYGNGAATPPAGKPVRTPSVGGEASAAICVATDDPRLAR